MIIQPEFGEWSLADGRVRHVMFTWRGYQRIAVFRPHPSGQELIGVLLTGYAVGRKLPRR